MSTPTISDLLDQVSALLGRRDLSQQEFQAWLGGSSNGGPNGDGRYPLTDSTGYVRLVGCPALLAAIGGNLSTSIAALGDAAQLDVVPEEVRVVGVGHNGGPPMRVSPFMFASRRTKDLDVLPGSEYAEWISCLSSTGLERKVAVSALTRTVGAIIDPSLPPYNVRFDFKKAKPVSLTAGSNVLRTADPVFSAADLGKFAAVGTATDQGPLVGYIGRVDSANSAALFTDLSFATPAPAPYSKNYLEMIWGTDNTVGMQRALDDAEPDGQFELGKVVMIGGIALVRQLRFGSISIVGLSATGCGFAALPVNDWNFNQQPFIADKGTGTKYGQASYNGQVYRADAYTIKDIVIYGQRFTSYYGTFRRNLEIGVGTTFYSFQRGAPYAYVEGLTTYEATWDGAYFAGPFAGQLLNFSAYSNAQAGARINYWDLNGQNWHAEGNKGPGIISAMPGANVNNVRASFNGEEGGRINVGGGYFPDEMGANWLELGYGNTVTNIRLQESFSHNLIISNTDPLNITPNGGGKNTFLFATIDDTGDMVPGQGRDATRLPPVRAMVYLKGGSVVNNIVDQSTGSPQVKQTNYATNGYWQAGYPSSNEVTLRTPQIANDPSAWFDGGVVPATARGPWGSADGASSISGHGNLVTINRQVAS